MIDYMMVLTHVTTTVSPLLTSLPRQSDRVYCRPDHAFGFWQGNVNPPQSFDGIELWRCFELPSPKSNGWWLTMINEGLSWLMMIQVLVEWCLISGWWIVSWWTKPHFSTKPGLPSVFHRIQVTQLPLPQRGSKLPSDQPINIVRVGTFDCFVGGCCNAQSKETANLTSNNVWSR